uniref:Sushi domain-containing protein n=1 Tax=Junco hyemalis TaxID=40217 RepID=A0A8C5JTT4_JUNHY
MAETLWGHQSHSWHISEPQLQCSLCACPPCACPACFSHLFSLSLGACGAPTRLQFAELNEEHRNAIDFPVGKTVQYTCRPGYAKVPGMSPTLTCLERGVWSEALEFCKSE